MYDLRYVKDGNGSNKTTPIVRYSEHVNDVSFHLGFDISPNGSILAAGMPFPRNTDNVIAGDDMVRKHRTTDSC